MTRKSAVTAWPSGLNDAGAWPSAATFAGARGFTRWLTNAAVLLPNGSAEQDESLEQDEDQTNAGQRIHAGGNYDRGGHHRPADRRGRAQLQQTKEKMLFKVYKMRL